MTFGEFVKILRSEQRLGLREFCVRYEHDPSNWSKIERGVIPPPKDLGLQEKLAAQLGLAFARTEVVNADSAVMAALASLLFDLAEI